MTYVGGDILEVTYNHPTVGSGSLFCKAQEDATINRGGYTSVDDMANITGDGQDIITIGRTKWKAELPPIAWDMTDVDEQDKLVEMAGSPLNADWTIQVLNGAIFSGNGRPVGDIPGATNSAQITLVISGGGKLNKIG